MIDDRPRTVTLSAHSIERWIERVDPGASRQEARLALGRFVTLGRVRPTPRHWMRGRVRHEPGTRFAYHSSNPRACAVVKDGVVVTVLTRELLDGAPRRLQLAPPPAPRPTASERARWRWSGDLPELGEAA